MTVPEYSAGDWTAVVRPGFVALLGPQVADATVRAVWAGADAGVLGVLALLAREGFEGLPPFAIVAVDRRRLHVALRGDVEVEVGGELLVPGAVSTWSERVVDDAPGVVVRAAGAPAGRELPIAEGVVLASAVRVGFVAEEALVPADAVPGEVGDVAPDAVVPAQVEPTEAAATEVEPVAVEPVVPVEVVPVAVEPADEAAADLAPVDAGFVEAEAVDHAQVALEPLEDDEDEDPDAWAVPLEPADEDDVRSAVPWFPTSAVPATEPSEVVAAAEALLQVPVTVEGASPDDHDGMTIMSADLASIRDQLPAWAADDAGRAFPVPVPHVAPARVVLSTGVVVELDRPLLVGRAPQVSRVANSELPRLVTVPSPQQDISRTHAEVRSEGDVVLVTDLDSTNGVHVARPGHGARRLHPGEPSVVDPGEVVDLGDGVTFTVERGA